MYTFARVISFSFDPIIISTISLILIIYQAERDLVRVASWFVLIFMIGILPPLLFLAYQKKTGRVTDWFLYNRKERGPIYVASLISLSISLLVIWKLDGPYTILIFSLASLLNALVLAVATYYNHKPSVHASATTFFVLTLYLLYSYKLWPLFLLIPLVAWSRARLKKHTWPQLLAGTSITLIVVLFTLKLFAFI